MAASDLRRGPQHTRPSVPWEERACTYRELAAMLDKLRLKRRRSAGLKPETVYRRWRNLLVVELLAGTGLRASELAALDVDDIRIPQSRDPWVRVVGGKKRGAGQSDRVPLPGAIAAELGRWLQRLSLQRPDMPLFRRGLHDTRHLDYRHVWRIVKQAAKAAGLRGTLSPHSLRHYFITELARTGNAIAVATIARLRDPKTVLRYVHLARGQIRELVDGVRIPGRRRRVIGRG